MQQVKRVIVVLPINEYQRLANVAASQVREVDQQAAFYVRRALQRSGEARVQEPAT
jgi:hypothetical protein